MAAAVMPETPVRYADEIPRGSDRSRLAIMQAICERVANGELVKEAAEAEGITAKSVWQWSESDPALGELYARARVSQAHSLAEEAVRLADDEGISADSRRVRVDTRKWFVSKIAPKLYGDFKQPSVSISLGSLHLAALQQPNVPPVALAEGVEVTALPAATSEDDTRDSLVSDCESET